MCGGRARIEKEKDFGEKTRGRGGEQRKKSERESR